ncbi:polysaccharide pyruvyl transferase family protein [Pelobacter propionicus]|uniref:Polysaccharide pyruvyl transferase domain-containing protein n=1 Tax=Pelobacter propionicus (strain DSM 2379 / NBRC 103807 / OttBd1) TaxID=338966 RepID=A1ATF9_PELPD|nr:polysaccharide pyruvyl transferase family protein [Pelobacter propionicus]ABL00630.1 conserved hypothetical protein [Pelobacter propionicus DSM 2379]
MTHHNPTAKVAIFNDTRRTSHYGCEIVMQTLEEQLSARNMTLAFSWPMGRDWRNELHRFDGFSMIDAIIVNGEGSIHHSDTRDRAHYLTETARYFGDTYGIPCFLINATLYEIGDDIIDNLRYFDGIWVRESSSQELLKTRGISANLAPDLTLMVDTPVTAERPFSVLATDSVIKPIAAHLKMLCRKKKWHYSKLTHASRPLSQDHFPRREVLRRNAKWLAALLVGRNIRNRHEFLRYMSSHQLVCTGRFHAVTLALATRTPYLAVASNTPKISSLTMDVFGTLDRVVPLERIDTVHDPLAFGWSEQERNALSRFLLSSRNSIAMMFDEIRAIVDARTQRK